MFLLVVFLLGVFLLWAASLGGNERGKWEPTDAEKDLLAMDDEEFQGFVRGYHSQEGED